MKQVLEVAGVSKQALHKHNLKQKEVSLIENAAIEAADLIREEHPMMGCRTLYQVAKPACLGRYRFEELLLEKGYRVRYKPNFIRTTYSCGSYFPNLIEGLELTNVNQVWQSDITYFHLNGRFYYLTFIIDVYSRKIVGFAASRSLHAQANIAALKMALKARKGAGLGQLIHHSDRGGQYIDKE